MSRRITISAKGLDKLVAKLTGGAIIRDELRVAFTRSAILVESEAKKLAPVDRGRLRAGITHAVDSSQFPTWAEVGTNASYAKAVHEGRRPGIMPPVKAIEGWAKRKGLSAWAVAKSIEKHGTKPNPFLADALDAMRPKIEKEFTGAIERMRSQWGR